MTSEPPSDVSFVVLSNDRYADVWPGYFTLLFRFWPDLPYKLYLISNHVRFPDERVIAIQVGDDLSWSQTLASGLARVPTRHVLLTLEDYYLTAPVDTAKVRRLHDAMVERGAVYLRLMGAPNPDYPDPHLPEIGMIKKGAAYRTSTQLAFWDRQTLIDLLEKETVWQFELTGARRSDRIAAPFLSVYAPFLPVPYQQVVRGGKWTAKEVEFFSGYGIAFDFSKRPIESKFRLWLQTSLLRRILSRLRRALFGDPTLGLK